MSKLLQRVDPINPFTFMRRVTDELDRAFGRDPLLEPGFYPRVWSPAIEVFELGEHFFVRLEVPGMKKEDLKIEVTHDELVIEGERKFENEKEFAEKGFYRTERMYGSFSRRVEIPPHVKAEEAEATFKNGVLEIQMPVIPVPDVKKRTLAIKG